MKAKTSLLAVVLMSGSLVMAPGLLRAQDSIEHEYRDSHTRTGDDSALPPGVPGFTDDEQDMSRSDVLDLEQALAENGYDPGRVDGIFDSRTRAAIEKFQQDHQLAATGIVDPATGELLGVVIMESS
jgi:murein L,D-transpeptidase YcbB/YkuD